MYRTLGRVSRVYRMGYKRYRPNAPRVRQSAPRVPSMASRSSYVLSPSAPARRRRASAAQAMRIRRALMWACTALACVATYRVSSQPSAGDSTLAMFDDGVKSSATFTSRREDGVDVMRHPTPSLVSSSMVVDDALAREGGDAEREVVSTPRPTPTSRGRLLTLSTHGALMTFDIDTKKSTVVHEGRGVYYGIFPVDAEEAGDVAASTGPHGNGHLAYVASRPDNADITSPLTDSLLLIDLEKGVLVRDLKIDSKFTHDVVKRGSQVFIADTGGGRVLELEYPSMRVVFAAEIGVRQHVNTIVPADVEEYGMHTVWAVLHNLGPSMLVLIDLEKGKVLKTLDKVGLKSHGCVPYKNGFIMLNSGEGQLIYVNPAINDFDVLWIDPSNTFMKGLVVIDDVAYFGVSAFGKRWERGDPSKTSDIVAFDLVSRTMLWRETVQTLGLLNVIAAPMIDEASTWKAISWGKDDSAIPAITTQNDESRFLQDTVQDDEFSNWIDLSAKERPESSGLSRQNMILMYKPIDVRDLQNFINTLPRDAFKAYAQEKNAKLGGRTDNMEQFKPNVDTMILIFSDRSGKETYVFPYWHKLKRYVTPILTDLFNKQLGIQGDPFEHIIRLQLAVMNPGSEIKRHVDRGGWAKNYHRFHVPIFVPSDQDATEFVMSPMGASRVNVPLSEGVPFEINNAIAHWVRNSAQTWRIHLLIDFDEEIVPPERRHTLEPGDVCDYSKLDSGCIS